jgi:hypothetical protein
MDAVPSKDPVNPSVEVMSPVMLRFPLNIALDAVNEFSITIEPDM